MTGTATQSERARRGGFTVTELLVVVSIMALLATASLPSLGGLGAAGKTRAALSDMSGLLEQARQYAVAQGTYVWVVFRADTDAQGQDRLSVAVLASRDGTDPNSDPSSAYDYGTVPGPSLDLISKVRAFSRLQLHDAGTFTSSDLASLAGMPTAGTANDLSRAATFGVRLPGDASASSFTKSIQFLPTGEARNGPSPIDLLELDLQPIRAASLPDPSNVAVVRVCGLTGQTLVYRR